MRFLKTVHKWFMSVVLMITLISFSGVSSTVTNFSTVQIELVSNRYNVDNAKVLYGDAKFNSRQNIIYNQYTDFTFGSLLKGHNFNFSVTFKSQKETILQFNEFHNTLQQNLIAQIHSSNFK